MDPPIKYCVLSMNLHTEHQLENYYSVFREEILDFKDIKFEYILTFCSYMSILLFSCDLSTIPCVTLTFICAMCLSCACYAYHHASILVICLLFPLIAFSRRPINHNLLYNAFIYISLCIISLCMYYIGLFWFFHLCNFVPYLQLYVLHFRILFCYSFDSSKSPTLLNPSPPLIW